MKRIRLAWVWPWMGAALWPMAVWSGFFFAAVNARFPLAPNRVDLLVTAAVFGVSTLLVIRLAHLRVNAGQLGAGLVAAPIACLGVGPWLPLVPTRLAGTILGDWPIRFYLVSNLVNIVIVTVILSLGSVLGLRLLLARIRSTKARQMLIATCLAGVLVWAAMLLGSALPVGAPWLYDSLGESSVYLEYQTLYGTPLAALATIAVLWITGAREPTEEPPDREL